MAEVKHYTVTLPDNRTLAVVEAGDEKSPAVIVHNGTPAAPSLFTGSVEDALSRGLRIITYGRPGYGKSTRQPERTIASAAQDTGALCDILGIKRFATWGISGGGPHALACAALLGDRVVAAASLAGVAPYGPDGIDDFMAGMGEDNVAEFGAAIAGEKELLAFLEPQVPALADADAAAMAEHMHTLLSEVDRNVLTDDFGLYLATSTQDAVKEGFYGWVDDDLAFTKPWDFSFSDINVPLQIWQGSQDLMVPYRHGEWLAKHIPQAEAHLSDDDGHLTLYVKRVPEVHAWMAKHF